MGWPKVAVLLITWDRFEELIRTAESLMEHLHYASDLHLHLADDDSDSVNPGYLDRVMDALRGRWNGQITRTITHRKGWGANVNTGLRYLIGEGYRYIYQQEDDYVLTKHLDLRAGVLLLQEVEALGFVRYRGILGHRLVAEMKELKPAQNLNQEGLGLPDRLSYWELEPKGSKELYVYSHGPHLKDVRKVHRRDYGFYPEGEPLGRTEEMFAHLVKDSPKSRVAIFPEWCPMWYQHIGKSRQHTELDRQSSAESKIWESKK